MFSSILLDFNARAQLQIVQTAMQNKYRERAGEREIEIEQIVFNNFLLFYILYATYLLLSFLRESGRYFGHALMRFSC